MLTNTQLKKKSYYWLIFHLITQTRYDKKLKRTVMARYGEDEGGAGERGKKRSEFYRIAGRTIHYNFFSGRLKSLLALSRWCAIKGERRWEFPLHFQSRIISSECNLKILKCFFFNSTYRKTIWIWTCAAMKEKQSGKIQTIEELDALVNAKYMEYHKKIDLKSFRWVRGEKKKNYFNFSPSPSFSSHTLADWYTIFSPN